jgi:hypothetical protein
MDEAPAIAFRHKKASSLRVCFDMAKAGEVDAVVSAGNSGALMAGALIVLGRIGAVERPAIATTFPTRTGQCALLDMGANVDLRPSVLAQFAVLGATYARLQHKKPRPRVGILSNGTEEQKGDGAHARGVQAAEPNIPRRGWPRVRIPGLRRRPGHLQGHRRRGGHRWLHGQRLAQGLRGLGRVDRRGGQGRSHAREFHREAWRLADAAGVAPVQASLGLRRDRRRASHRHRRRGHRLSRRLGRAGDQERHPHRGRVRQDRPAQRDQALHGRARLPVVGRAPAASEEA